MDDKVALAALDMARLLVAASFLGAASVQDWRTRRVEDRVWLLMLVPGTVLLAVHVLLFSPGPLYLIALLPPLAFMVPALVGTPEAEEIARGNRTDILWTAVMAAGAAAFVAELLLFDFRDHWRLSFGLAAIPLVILVVYGMYAMGLIHGGADAKALMCIAVLFPLHPDLTHLGVPRLFEETLTLRIIELVFPFAVTALFNAVLAFAFVPLAFFALNASRGELSGARTFFGYMVDVERLKEPGTFVWLMETAPRRVPGGPGGKGRLVEGKRSVMALRDADPAREARWFRKAGVRRVWVTPKIPFIIPITAGTVAGVLFGNVFLHLFTMVFP